MFVLSNGVVRADMLKVVGFMTFVTIGDVALVVVRLVVTSLLGFTNPVITTIIWSDVYYCSHW